MDSIRRSLVLLECLMKMALIHDDRRNPRMVYRMQDQHGRGPYHSTDYSREVDDYCSECGGSGKYKDTDEDCFNCEGRGLISTTHQDTALEHQDPETQPLPEDDFEPEEAAQLVGNKGLRFAFEHPEHAREWFDNKQLQQLKSHGFSLKPVAAAKVWRSRSGRQVMFEPSGGDDGGTH